MSDLSQPHPFLAENPAAVPIETAARQAYAWLVAALGGSAAVALLVFAVATQSGADAERIAGAGGRSSLPGLIGHLAAAHGRPGAF